MKPPNQLLWCVMGRRTGACTDIAFNCSYHPIPSHGMIRPAEEAWSVPIRRAARLGRVYDGAVAEPRDLLGQLRYAAFFVVSCCQVVASNIKHGPAQQQLQRRVVVRGSADNTGAAVGLIPRDGALQSWCPLGDKRTLTAPSLTQQSETPYNS